MLYPLNLIRNEFLNAAAIDFTMKYEAEKHDSKFVFKRTWRYQDLNFNLIKQLFNKITILNYLSKALKNDVIFFCLLILKSVTHTNIVWCVAKMLV